MTDQMRAFMAKQKVYEAARALRREQWAISEAEDWCVRKEVEPGTYKPLWQE